MVRVYIITKELKTTHGMLNINVAQNTSTTNSGAIIYVGTFICFVETVGIRLIISIATTNIKILQSQLLCKNAHSLNSKLSITGNTPIAAAAGAGTPVK